jgi:hypothetical protein
VTNKPATTTSDKAVALRANDLLQAIATGQIEVLQDKKAVALAIVEQILTAGTLDEAFDNTGTIASKDMVDTPLLLEGVQLMPGELEDAQLPAYVLLRCRDANGNRLLVNSGSARVMAQALYAQIHELLPLMIAVIEVGKARAGQNAPLGLTTL